MALEDSILDDEDRLSNPLGGPGQAPAAGGGGASITGGGSTGSQAPAGAGGSTGGWTNIQSYLDANKGASGSAQALDKTVSGQFGQERDALSNQSQAFLGDANQQVKDNSIDTDQASNLLKGAASQYSWGASQPTEYQDTVKKFQGALTNDYGGPKEYNYGFGAKTQEYGDALKGGAGMDKVMGDVYGQAAGGPLSRGQFNLQSQLDVSNENLANTKKNLAGSYDQLGADRDKTVQDTTAKLGDVEKGYRTNQNKLKDWLYGQGNQYQGAIDKAENDARTGYNTSYNTGSGLGSALQGTYNLSLLGTDPYTAAGVSLGPNATFKQLQAEKDLAARNGADFGPILNNTYLPSEWTPLVKNQLTRNSDSLNNFYTEQDTKYGNTADEEERSWNAIQDFLNTGATKKDQGFSVR